MAEHEDITQERIRATRRGFFGLAAGAGLMVGTLAVSAAPITLSSLWARRNDLLAEYLRADAESDAAYKRYVGSVPPRPREAYVSGYFWALSSGIEWFCERSSSGKLHYYGMAEQWTAVVAKREAKGDRVSAERARHRASVMQEYSEFDRRLRRESGLDEADARLDRASAALDEVETAIIAIPAVSIRDLAIKVAVVRRQDQGDYEEYGSKASIALLADIERMALSA